MKRKGEIQGKKSCARVKRSCSYIETGLKFSPDPRWKARASNVAAEGKAAKTNRIVAINVIFATKFMWNKLGLKLIQPTGAGNASTERRLKSRIG